MSNKITSAIFAVLYLTVFSYCAYLRIHDARRIHEPRSFGDTEEYFNNAELPIFSTEFWTHERPPLTAIFWKMANLQPEGIFKVQLYFSILSWGILAITTARVVENNIMKIFIYTAVLAFSLSRDIFMWDPFLGSESISLSFTALFIASCLWLLHQWDWRKAVLVVINALLMLLARDTYMYLLLMSAIITILVFGSGKYRQQAAGISIAFLVICLLSAKISVLGLRPFRAILMNTALRIYPSKEYTEYFREHGMPIDDQLVKIARNPLDGKKFTVYLSLLRNENQEKYRQWVRDHGSVEYAKFLWFYKSDTFQSVFLETPSPSFYPDVYYYTATGYRPIIKDASIAELLYPTRFGLVFFFMINLLSAFISALAWRDRKALWFVPLLMILLAYPQAVLIWASDVNDIARHSIAHNVLYRLGFWLLLFFVIDSICTDFLAKQIFFKQKDIISIRDISS